VEASALIHASRRGLLARRSRVLKLQGDEKLVALIRAGHDRAFEALFDRYHSRLLAFCQHMLSSKEDAEDVLQDVFVAAHKAMLADNRRINVRPWLYRIARNRCLNHLRRPVPEGQDSMDILPHENGASTLERVQNREEFRRLVADVGHLPETQRTALLLREVDAMSYEEIAQAMDTTVPSVKSLLVRARITLAEASQARLLTCGEVQLELAEAAEGLRKASGPVRQHVRGCDGCADFRSQLRSDSKALSALAPLGGLALLKDAIVAKLATLTGGGGSTAGGGAAGGGAAAGGAAGAGGAAAGSGMAGAAFTATGAAGAAGGIGGAIGAKAAAGVATAALLTAGAVEVNHYVDDSPAPSAGASKALEQPAHAHGHAIVIETPKEKSKPEAPAEASPAKPELAAEEPTAEPTVPTTTETTTQPAAPPEEHPDPSAGASEVSPAVSGDVAATPVGTYAVGTGTVEEAPAAEPPPEDLPPVEDPPPPPPLGP
jgi:RNA polymerase sigma factor (sigma-70 family)